MKRNLIIYLVVLCFCLLTSKISAQILVEPFDSTLNGWTTSDTGAFWKWDTIAVFGADTFVIISPSGGGGAVMVSEDVTNETILTSPNILTPTENRTFLRFNQYLRMSDNDKSFVIVESTDGSISDTFQLNLNTTLGGITTPYNVQNIEITSVTQNTESIQVKFVISGDKIIWIIDDINIDDSINTTFPIGYIGDSLINYGIPYDLDSLNWPYVPHQVVVQFYPGTTPFQKDSIREEKGFERIESCCNSEIELWLEQAGGANIPINELTKGDDGDDDDDDPDVGIQDVELNKYNFNQLQNTPPTPWAPLNSLPVGIPSTDDNAIIIAILDTGIDYKHDDLKEYIWNNPTKTDTCYVNDFIGWNFVHDNNNPEDDHSHGTHVAGIIVDNMLEAGIPDCGFRIMPLKTHTLNGTSNLFDATCATYYAISHNANVINDSWGFYGSSSKILKRAMKRAMEKEILIVTSSGNDSIALDNTPAFPACDSLDNIITVGSHNRMDSNGIYRISGFSNYSSSQVDILALGDYVLSAVPGSNGLRARKTGTSMASPAMAAILAREYCENNIAYVNVKNRILEKALRIQGLNDKSKDGKILVVKPISSNIYTWCLSNWILLCCIIALILIFLFWFRRNKFNS